MLSLGATTSIVLAQSKSATLALSSSATSFVVGDIFSVTITLDTKGSAVDGIDIIYLNYSPSLLEVQDDDSAVAGTQIGKGSLMSNTLLNSVDASGKISFSQVADASSSYVGVGTLATVRFKALAAGTASVTFDFTSGSTADTNVASDGVDILTAVTDGSYAITSSSSVPDVAPPVRSGGLPTGTLGSGTVQTTLSLATNENATCKYGTTANVAYGSLPNTFSTTGGTAHSTALSGLSDGAAYSYYVRCTDTVSNANPDDYAITFSVAIQPPANTNTGGGGGGGGSSYTPPTTTTSSTTTSTQPTTTNTAQTPTTAQASSSPYLPAGIPEGSLVRGPDGIKVWIVNYHGYKRHIFNPAVFNMYGHFKWDQIKSLDQPTLDSIKTSDFYRADGDTRVFSLKEIDERQGLAQKRWMNIAGEKFTQLGYKWEQVFIINTKERDYYQEGIPLSEQELAGNVQQLTVTTTTTQQTQLPTIKISAGMLVKSPDGSTIYYITPALLKKPIPSIEVFNSYNNQWSSVKAISKQQLDSILSINAIRLVGGSKVYLLENNAKRWVKTQDAFYRLGLDWNKIAQVNQTELNYYPEGSVVE